MKIYLERQCNHRQPSTLLGAVILIVMGGVVLWGLFRIFDKTEMAEFSIGFLLITLLMLGSAGLFVYAGNGLAYGWLTNRTDLLTITEEGIGHFGKFIKWDEIKWLSYGCKKKGEPMIFYQKKGLGFDRYLAVTEPLSTVEIEALFHELKVDLKPKYEELKIG